MAKIVRKLQKLFGSTAGATQIGKFGSLAAGTPAYTTDPDVIQSLSNFLAGWNSAVLGENSPAIQDENALAFLWAYQIAYILQTGVPEYNAATTYYIGSLVNDGLGNLYVSLTDNNTGNALSDGTKWGTPPSNGLLVPNVLPLNKTVTTGNSLSWNYLTIPTGKTITVQTGAQLVTTPSIVIEGTGTLVVEGTGIVKVF